MNQLLRILQENPILLVILVVWIAGAVGNVARSAKKGEAERKRRYERMADDREREARIEQQQARPAARSADEVAAEMRRILGMEEAQEKAPARGPAARPEPLGARRDVAEPERAPRPVMPSTAARTLDVHVDPHVGDKIKERHLAPGRAGLGKVREIGTLGGRAHEIRGPRRRIGARYSLADLKTAIVLNEILGPPLALRGPEERLR